MRLIQTILLLFLLPLSLCAQSTNGKKHLIKGNIIDEKKSPVISANITLYKYPDSSQITIVTSDEKGNFEIAADPGHYYANIKFLSFEEKNIDDIKLTVSDIDLGKIVLKTDVKLLNEVIVSSEKKLMEMELDKRVYNVSLDVSNIGANASEILANIPSVTVDLDGNVSLRGSQGVRILVDGKPSALTGIRTNEALNNLQGAMIDRIEVITNPSSRYDAAGETGIINIILKKNKTRGFNGNFTGTVGYPSNYSAAYSVNYRTQKMNLFSSFGTRYRRNTGKGFSTQNYSGVDTSFIYTQDNSRRRRRFSINLVTGIDYYVTPNTTLTGSFLIDGGGGRNINRIVYEDYNNSGQVTRSSFRTDDEKENKRNTEVSLSFRKKYPGREDKEWTADFKWTNSGETEKSDYEQGDLDGNGLVIQRSGNPAYEDNILFQTDYVHPFNENMKFETGFKGTLRKIINEYLVEEQTSSGDWIILPEFNNNMEFRENIYAGYAIFSHKTGNFSYQLGARGELTKMRTGLVKTSEVNDRNYFNLFPSAALSYQLNDNNTIQFSYSYRINRPWFRNLTPFANFSDPRVYFVGNPNLNPEFTHSYEAGYLAEWEKGSILSGIYYRHKNGVVERIRTIDSVSGITRIVPVNLSTRKDLGVEFTLSLDPAPWWKLTSNVNFFRAHTKGIYKDKLLESKTFSWTNRTTSRMTFFKKLDFQASLNYHSPGRNTQGRNLAMYSIDLGMAKDVFKDKGTLTFNVRDLLNTRRRRSIVDIPGYYSRSDFQWRPRQFTLTLNFRINQQKIEQEEQRGEENGFENN